MTTRQLIQVVQREIVLSNKPLDPALVRLRCRQLVDALAASEQLLAVIHGKSGPRRRVE